MHLRGRRVESFKTLTHETLMLFGLRKVLAQDLRKLWQFDSLRARLELIDSVFLGAVNVCQVLDDLVLDRVRGHEHLPFACG